MTGRNIASRITWAVTAAVATAGIIMSADQLVRLAGLAGWVGFWMQILLPVLLDGSGIAGGLAYQFGPTKSARRWGLGVLIESAALSVFGNVAAHLITGDIAPVWVSSVVAVAVPLQIVLTVHMGILLSTRPREDAAAAADTATEVTAEAARSATINPAAPAQVDEAATNATAVSTPIEIAATPVATPQPEPAAESTEPVLETQPEPTSETEPEPAQTAGLDATQPLPRLHAVRSPESAADTSDEGSEGGRTEDDDLATRGAIQAAMYEVFYRHLNAGTLNTLGATQLAREAGAGTRQLASRYLKQWKTELEAQLSGQSQGRLDEEVSA